MIKKIFSIKIAIILLLTFAISIGWATFIENDYGTQSARAIVYNAQWFEILLISLTTVLIYNIYRYKMYKRAKWASLMFHLSFVLIFVGAGMTRYIGFEGIMHIREGSSSSSMVSDVMILDITATKDKDKSVYKKPIYLSSRGSNWLDISLGDVDIELLEYMPSVGEKIVADKNSSILEMKVTLGSGSKDILLKKGEIFQGDDFIISFQKRIESSKEIIYIKEIDGKLSMDTTALLKVLDMKTQKSSTIDKGNNRDFSDKKLYQIGSGGFVLRKYHSNSTTTLASTSLKPQSGKADLLRFKVSYNDISKIVDIRGIKGTQGDTKEIKIGDITLSIKYGVTIIKLPFEIKLVDFELARYPGSQTPSSYSSKVVLIDKEEGLNMPFHIYMNHILNYRGYKFFQSSYDRDEKGTILSVNNDPGTLPTYIGYFLLTIGLLWVLFTPKGRFQILLRATREIQKGALALLALLAIFNTTNLNAQDFNLEHANKFARLIVQDNQGRMKPIDTLASQIVTKITRKSSFEGLHHNQIFLGMIVNPESYQNRAMIKIGHPKIAKELGYDENTKYAKFSDFFTKDTNEYKLYSDLMRISRTKPVERSKYDKELVKVDERVNIAYMVYTGSIIKIFPTPNDANNLWVSPTDAISKFPTKDAKMVRLIMMEYFNSLTQSAKSGDYTKPDRALDMISKFQNGYGKSVIPSQSHITFEILYNKLGIFGKLIPIYILVGLILLILSFIHIINPSFNLKRYTKIVLYIIILAFITHTIGLIIRWYISGHAPWSNAYESIVYISWATLLAGFMFMKNSPITLASTSILSGVLLFVAHLNWIDPQITNLMPVLKSYWLMIHVAVITASYGFLGLGALLSFMVFILYIISTPSSQKNIKSSIKELTQINEMALIIGLILLTVGNFLGGVWANESWGRYWGWDSKETWAAVTILIYTVVIHLRLVPKFKSIFIYNVASLLAYSSVLMTYFGVNFYLSGLHSYAAGDPLPVPAWILPSVIVVFIIIGFAYRKKEIMGKG